MEIRDFAALVGMITGVSGFTLSIINYRREEPKLNVGLQWNCFSHTDNSIDKTHYVTKVTVANSGKRSVYITNVSIIVPKKYGANYTKITLSKRVTGVKLGEGEAPELYELDQNNFQNWLETKLNKFPEMQKDLIAVVTDSTGKEYKSAPCKDKIKFGFPHQ